MKNIVFICSYYLHLVDKSALLRYLLQTEASRQTRFLSRVKGSAQREGAAPPLIRFPPLQTAVRRTPELLLFGEGD